VTKAEIEQYIEEDLKSLDLNLSVKSIEHDGAGAWNISMKCPRCGNVDFTVRQYGDSPIKQQIQSHLKTHAVTH
jgi:phage FluMu protein Com